MKLTKVRLVSMGFAALTVASAMGCGKNPSTPTSPTQSQNPTPAPGPGASPSLASPVLRSPVANVMTDTRKPSLTVSNAVASGSVGSVTYQFEVSESNAFPADSRSSSITGVAQGDGSTSWVPPSELIPGFLYYWHARATNGAMMTDWSQTETFRTP